MKGMEHAVRSLQQEHLRRLTTGKGRGLGNREMVAWLERESGFRDLYSAAQLVDLAFQRINNSNLPLPHGWLGDDEHEAWRAIREAVRTIVMLDYKMPPGFGSGWGCFQCGLPCEGATAVLCDQCTELMQASQKRRQWGMPKIKFICTGVNEKTGRLAVNGFDKVPHKHDMSKHPEA